MGKRALHLSGFLNILTVFILITAESIEPSAYGWINNEVGEWKGDRLVFDIVSIDGEPDFFKGVRWRSFIHKYSDNEVGSGLEVSKEGEPFRLYGETKARRVL